MPIKKIELEFHPANPLNEIIADVNENFEAIISSFETLNSGQGVIGQRGDRGEKGEQGVNGVQGERGLQGEQGPAGQDGKDGKDGVDGKDGLPGAVGAQGPAGVQGIQGETGAQGIQGPTGATGTSGAAGAQGVAGPAGAQGIPGVGIKGFASGYVDAGTFVTLDNVKVTVATTGNRGLSVATVSGTMVFSISSSYSLSNGTVGGASTAWPGATYTTTPSTSWFGYHFGNAGDGSTYIANDYTNQKVYRITLMIGPGYTKNFISIERLM